MPRRKGQRRDKKSTVDFEQMFEKEVKKELQIKKRTNVLKDSNRVTVNNSNSTMTSNRRQQQAALQEQEKEKEKERVAVPLIEGLALLAADQTADKSIQCSFDVWVSSSDEEVFTEQRQGEGESRATFAAAALKDPAQTPAKGRERRADRDSDSDNESSAESTERHMGDLISKEAETLLATKQLLTLENSELARDNHCLSDQVEVLKSQNQCLSEELEELKSENSRLNFECGLLSRRTSFQFTPPLRPYSHSTEKPFEAALDQQRGDTTTTPFQLDLKEEKKEKAENEDFIQWTLAGAIFRGLEASKESISMGIRDLWSSGEL